MDLRETEISSKQIFTGRIVDLAVRTIKLPNGETAAREVVKHQPAAAAIAVNDRQEMLLVEQWREPIKKLTLEIPAGLIDETDASPLDAMKRELNEEGGYHADYW
ncbi:NUDIX hydrolase, partial [Lactobacillus sp. XV13L]|nr:NUDIX hydrolase [Lactobacillus sp. XV13L]